MRRHASSRTLLVWAVLAGATAASAEGPHPLPGNPICAFPKQAEQSFVGGSVVFHAEVRADGSVDSVQVTRVPRPRLGFEETVAGCVRKWRFEPAAKDAPPRRFNGRLRYRLDDAAEDEVGRVLVEMAAAWNAGDPAALPVAASRAAGLRARFQRERQAFTARIELAPEFAEVHFIRRDLVSVRQPLVLPAEPGIQDAPMLEAMLVKEAEAWRIASWRALAPWGGAAATKVGGEIREPRKTHHAPPRYPESAKENRIQGLVILECIISAEGKVDFVRVLSGEPPLDAAAVEAVEQWEYTPTLLNGVAVPVIMTVKVNFRLS
jgi:TonB family protein